MTRTITLVQEAEQKLASAIKDLEDLHINGNHQISIIDVTREISETREILINCIYLLLRSKITNRWIIF